MFAGLLLHENTTSISDWVDPQDWLKALYPRFKPDISGFDKGSQSLLVEADIYNTPESHSQTSLPTAQGELRVSFWGRLDNREELAEKLAIPSSSMDELPDVQLIIKGWNKWREDLPKHLCGDFAIAIIDTEQNTLFLARDPMGVKPLFYWPHKDGFIFASNIAAFTKLKNIKPTICKEWAAKFLMYTNSRHETTAYAEIKKLAHGHAALIRDGVVKIFTYHIWEDNSAPTYKTSSNAVNEYKAMLEETISNQMASDYPLGIEVSGGIDSSTLAAYIGKLAPSKVKDIWSFSFATYDKEEARINEVLESASIENKYIQRQTYYDVQTLIDDIHTNTMAMGYPALPGIMTNSSHFYKLCEKHKVRTLFSGFGGDEAVTSRTKFLILSELYDKKQFLAIFKIMPGNWIYRIVRTGLFTLRQWKKDRSKAPQPYEDKMLWELSPLKDQIVTKFNLYQHWKSFYIYYKGFRRHNDRIIQGEIPFELVQERLECCTLTAANYGVDYRWPLWGQALVQHYLSTPIVERLGPQMTNRYLHRRAIDGLAPDCVTWQEKQDIGGTRDEDTAYTLTMIPQMVAILKNIYQDMHPILEAILEKDRLLEYIDIFESVTVETKLDNESEFYYVVDYVWLILSLNMWLHGRALKL